jgi:hypothetical protein
MKKTIMALLAAILLVGTSTTANAEENYVPMKCVDINELSNLPYEETYTYQEVLADMEHNNLISKEEVNAFKASNSKLSIQSSQEIRYSTFYMDSYSFKDDVLIGAKTYVLQPRIYVGLTYVNGSTTPSKIASIDAPYIYTGGGTECKFAGNIFYRLEAGNRFFMGINGDAYKTGAVTTKIGLKVGVGDSSTISYEISSTKDYLKNVAWDCNYYSAGLQP